jgi:hypothetical protein
MAAEETGTIMGALNAGPRRSRRGLAACCAITFGAAAWQAQAAPRIEVRKGDCKSGVHLSARGAPLSQVLKTLSETLEFQYKFEGERDPLIDIDATRQPVDLVRALAPEENVSLTQARDRKCPERDRIVRVWVLPKGKQGAARPIPAPTPVVSPEAQKAYEEYLSAHGMRLAPDGREEVIPQGK